MKKPNKPKAPAIGPGQPRTTPTRPTTAGLTQFDRSNAHESAPLPVWRAAFLTALATTGNVSAAARAAQITRARAYQVQAEDADFAADWQEALDIAVEYLEEEARKRAMGEYITYKFHAKTGKPLLHPVTGEPYYEHVASDALLTLLLKAHRPERFKDKQQHEHTGPNGTPLPVPEIRVYTGAPPLANAERDIQD